MSNHEGLIKRHILIVILALACTACGDKRPLNARMSNQLPPGSSMILEDLSFELEDSVKSPFLHTRDAPMEITVKYGSLPDETLGVATVGDEEHCPIVINSNMEPALGKFRTLDLHHVLMHEIGHCFGLLHDPDENQVMFWKYEPWLQNSAVAYDVFIRNLIVSRLSN